VGSATRGLWAAASVVTLLASGQKLPQMPSLADIRRALRTTWKVVRRLRPRHLAWTVLWTAHVLTFCTMFVGWLPMPVRMGGMVLAYASGSAVGFYWSNTPPRRRMLLAALAAFAVTVGPAALVLTRWFG